MNAPEDNPRVSALGAWLSAQSASALVLLDRPEDARSELSYAQDGRGHLPDAFERADMDHLHALIHLHLGRLDVAEQFATSSVRGWGEGDRRDGVLGEITSATIHVQAGEPDGLRVAHSAVTAVSKLRSQRARDRLAPLVEALDARSGSDYRELARMARQVAAARA